MEDGRWKKEEKNIKQSEYPISNKEYPIRREKALNLMARSKFGKQSRPT